MLQHRSCCAWTALGRGGRGGGGGGAGGGSAGPALLSRSLTLQLGSVAYCCSPVNWPASRTSRPRRIARSAVAACPARDPSPASGVLAEWTTARDALRRKNSSTSAAGSLGVPVALRNPAAERPLACSTASARALATGPRDFLCRCLGSAPPLPRPGDGDKLERRKSARRAAPLISEENPGERNFDALVEHLLSKIEAPKYRSLCCENPLSPGGPSWGSILRFRFDDNLALSGDRPRPPRRVGAGPRGQQRRSLGLHKA